MLRDSRPLSAKGVYLDDAGRVLLCLNWRDEWELPGGRPAPGENLEACVAHEVREETGLIVVADEMLSRYMFEVEPGHWINIVTYGCSLVGGQTVAGVTSIRPSRLSMPGSPRAVRSPTGPPAGDHGLATTVTHRGTPIGAAYQRAGIGSVFAQPS